MLRCRSSRHASKPFTRHDADAPSILPSLWISSACTLGHTPKIDLLPEWTERDATRSGTEKDSYGARRDSVRGERVDEEERPAARIMKEVRVLISQTQP